MSASLNAVRAGPCSWASWNLGAAPAYRELADVVRLLVLDGRVALDTALPSERALSEALGVSRTTVTAAYGHLRGAGVPQQRTRQPGPDPDSARDAAGHHRLTGPGLYHAIRGTRLAAPDLRLPGLRRRRG